MKYNFDEIIDRKNTDCKKVEECDIMFGTSDVTPLWIADMDFRTPDVVFDTIKERMNHPILGYTNLPKTFYPTVASWIRNRHGWNDVKEEWIGFLPGIVPGLSYAVQIFSNEGDEVIIQPPVYYPFITVTNKNNRKLVYNPLKVVDGYFEMDFEDLESKITPKTKILILCNPHNPGGKIWKKENLIQLAEICARHNITVIADEIHADMTLPGHKHIPFASVSETAKNISITFMAPSKSFNMPGLITAYYVIPNPEMREKMRSFLDKNELLVGNIFAYLATQAVYEKGEDWLNQMLEYVQENINFTADYFKKYIPEIKPMIPEASFLIFLDCKELGLTCDELKDFFVKQAKLGLNEGRMFGPGGEFCMRLNVACPRKVLEKALEQLKMAVEKKKTANVAM